MPTLIPLSQIQEIQEKALASKNREVQIFKDNAIEVINAKLISSAQCLEKKCEIKFSISKNNTVYSEFGNISTYISDVLKEAGYRSSVNTPWPGPIDEVAVMIVKIDMP